MKIASILLARIGSKRIKEKPLIRLGGKHLIEWTLAIMKELPYPGYVYSDSNQVRSIVNSHGLNSRNKILENKDGIHHTQEELREYNKEIKADILVLFQLTSPFRNIDTVKEWIKMFPLFNTNCALTVYPVKDIFYDQNAERIWPTYRGYQNNQRLYKETGSMYIFWKDQIEKNHITAGTRKLLIDSYDFDIDEYEDLEQAENFLKKELKKSE